MFTPIIGLEIHLQLKTKSKVFCSCSTSESEPNTNICPICLAYPGAMPNLNKEAVLQSIKMGLALNSKIANKTNWDRKNYMYPDLFKGYQISQLDEPICGEGNIEVLVRDRKNYYSKDNYKKNIGIFRAHLEEDTAKSIHGENETLLDANKAGIPLLEIVSKPEMYSVDEAVSYAKTIRNLARWFDISDCNLELGQMRFDANISICVEDIEIKNKKYEEWKGIKFTPIVEIKNLNSFGNLQSALDYEIKRQIEEYKKSGEVYKAGNKETRGWDEEKQSTYTQRKKEEANEYRYIPEPDIPELHIKDEEIVNIKSSLPKSPVEVTKELESIGIPSQAISLITEEKLYYDIYSRIVEKNNSSALKIANTLTNELASEINQFENLDVMKAWIEGLGNVFDALSKNEISSTEFKEILKNHKNLKSDWDELLLQIKNTEEVDIKSVLEKALADNPNIVEQIKNGKVSAKMFFVGIVMRQTKGKANPEEVKKLIDEMIML